MFCKNCGARIDDDAAFCDNCGAPQGSVQQPVYQQPAEGQPAAAAPKKKPPVGLFIGIGAGVLAVIVAVVLIIALGGKGGASSPGKVAEDMFKFYGKLYTTGIDANEYLSFFPESYAKKVAVEHGMTYAEFKKAVQEKLDQSYALASAFVDDYTILSAKATEIKDLDDDDIREMVEKFGLEITDAKRVTVKYTVRSNGEVEDSDLKVTAIKVGGRWYLQPESLDDVLGD